MGNNETVRIFVQSNATFMLIIRDIRYQRDRTSASVCIQFTHDLLLTESLFRIGVALQYITKIDDMRASIRENLPLPLYKCEHRDNFHKK